MGKVCLKIPTSYCTSNIWGAFDLPESESGIEIMILSHRFNLSESETGFRIRWVILRFMILSESVVKDGGDGVLHRLFEQIRNMISKQVNHTPKRIKYIH